MTKHTCSTLLIRCSDHRFNVHLNALLQSLNIDPNGTDYDVLSLPGASKERDTVYEAVRTLITLHEIQHIIIVHHEDCGAYGANYRQSLQETAARIAARTINEDYPHMKVECFFLYLDGKVSRIFI